jgi:hypothetical protein
MSPTRCGGSRSRASASLTPEERLGVYQRAALRADPLAASRRMTDIGFSWFETRARAQGVSALQIMRTVGFGPYKTAWYMCHRIRVALVENDMDKLGGIVEVDETFVGGKAENRHYDKRDGKPGPTALSTKSVQNTSRCISQSFNSAIITALTTIFSELRLRDVSHIALKTIKKLNSKSGIPISGRA